MYWQQPLNCLYFNNYAVVHKHIESITVQLQPVIDDGYKSLGLNFLARVAEFMC